MTRYEFEVLSHLERNGAGQYSLRTLSDALTISGGEISRCLEQLAAKHWITQDGDTLAVTDAGLAALEPYRVKRAIILAAGFGSRMMPATADRPKPLVTVNGVPILETLLDALTAVGIRDITIVRGYRKECFDALLEKYPFLTLVDNDIYSKTNNISSVMAVLDKLDGCYLCEADLYITNPQIITKYQYASNILGAYSLETDDWCFQMDGNGHIVNYQKGNTFCYNYYGISYWTQADSARLREEQSRSRLKERRFAASRTAEHRRYGAGRYGKRQVIHRRLSESRVAHYQTLERNAPEAAFGFCCG